MTLIFFRRLTLAALATLLLGGAGAGLAAETGKPPQGAAVYQQDIPEMNTLECAKCHPEVFRTIRDEGGQHRLECQDCHITFHNFKPGLSWEARMPACSDCHDQVHGESFPECLSCHRNAHAPLASLVGIDQLAGQCAACHAEAARAIEQNPSAHAELSCSECHRERHGYRPGCAECHPEPHTPYQEQQGCIGCHAPHAPLAISLGEDVPNRLCATCHREAADRLAQSGKKHQALACVFCHAGSHGDAATCGQCHGNGPHNPEQLANFDQCQDCHGDAHGLSLENKGN